MELFWIWLILGMSLLAAELLSGTFVIIFFGVGGVLTALLALAGFDHLAGQIIFFTVVSLILLLLFRKRFIKTPTAKEKTKSLSADVDTIVTLSETLPAKGETMISYQGTHWTAVNLENFEIKQGQRVRIERTEGIKIFVRPAP